MDPTKPPMRYVVTNCLDPCGVPSFRPEQSQESIHLQSSHEPHHSSHHRTPADRRARRLHRESEGKMQFHDDSGDERRIERTEGDLRKNNLIVSSSALRHYSSGGQPVPIVESVNNTSGNQYKEGEEGKERRRRGFSVRTGRALGVRLISPGSAERNVDSDDRRETGAKENKMEGKRGSRVTPLKYCKPLLVVVLLLLVFGTVQLISGKAQANQPLLLHREGFFSKKWWSRWALPPFFFLQRGSSSITMDHSEEFDDKKCDKTWWHPSAVVSFFFYSHRNNTSMESFNWRHFVRLITLSSMWRKPVVAVQCCVRSFDSLNSTLLRPLLQAIRKGKLLVQLVIIRSHQLVQFVAQACRTCVRSLTFLTKQNRMLLFSESANREKQCVIRKTSFIAGIVSNDKSNTCDVLMKNLVNGEENVFPGNASSTRRDTLYSASRLHQWMHFCYSMLRSLQAKWRSFAWRRFRIFKCFIQLVSTCKQWVMRGVGAALDRFLLVFRTMPVSSPDPATFTPLTESSTGMSSSSSSANKSRVVKWWRWRKTERLSFASPQCMVRYFFKTVNHCIRTRLWWCRSNALLAWRTISCSVQQTLFSFWNLIKIRQELMIFMKRKQKFKQNPKRFLNEINTSSGTYSSSNASVTSLHSHALHSQRRSKHLSFSVPSQLFYFVDLKDLHDPQKNEEKKSMTRKVANSECSELSLPEPSWVQQEIVRDLSLPSASFIKNLVTEVGVFIHFSRPEFGSFRNAAETASGSHTASEVPSAQDPEVNCSASPYSSLPRPVQSAAPFPFYRLSPPKRLVEVLRTRKGEYGAVKSGVNKREGVLAHRKKEEMKVPEAGPLRCPSHENETTWREQRKTIIAASAKCESEKEVLLQEKEALLQEWSECSKKAKDSVEAALRLEADKHAEHLQVTLAQQCNARLEALNASFQAARNKTNASLCDARRTPSNGVGRWMRNVAVNDTSAAQIKQTEAPLRSVHPPKEKTRKRLSAYEGLLRNFGVRSSSSLPSNSSMEGRLAGVPTTVLFENAKREVMLGVQEAIESRCSAECLTAAETSSGNDEQKPPHVRPPQCAEEATALHLRLTAQLENILTPNYFSPLRKTSPSSWSQVTSTLLLPQSLGNFCTLIWSGGIQDRHKLGQDVVNNKKLPVLSATSTRWYHFFHEHVRKMFFRVVWLTVVVGVLCLARGLYFLLEDNERLRCELQQATITAIQERMMHMEWMDDAQYSPPLRKGDCRSPLSYVPEATYPSKVDCVTSSSESKDGEMKSAAFFERDDAMRTSFLYLSSCLEMLYASLSESHFRQCELLWLMENEAPSEKVLRYLPPVKKKCISESSGTVLEGKSVLSSCQALVFPLAVPPENEVLCGTNEANEGDTRLLEVLLKGYFQAVEEHYLDLLHASIPPAFANRSDCVTGTVNTLMDDNVSANVGSCMTRRSKTPEKEGIEGGSGKGDTNNDHYPNSENGTACRRLPKVELERNNHHSEPRQSFCCLKWKLEAENAKNLMEMQAQTIRQLEEQLMEQLETFHTFPSTTTSVTQ